MYFPVRKSIKFSQCGLEDRRK